MKRNHTMRRNVLFLSMEKVVNGSITIILIPVLIRAIGIEHYGLWALLLGIFSYLQCMDLGLLFSLERYVAFYQEEHDRKTLQHLITTSLTYALLLCAAALIFSIFAGEAVLRLLIKDSTTILQANAFLFLFPAIAANFLQSVFMSIPRGFQQFNISSKIQIAGKLIFTIVLLSTLFKWKSVYSPLVAYSAQTVFTTVAYALSAKSIVPDIHFLKLGISLPHLKLLIGFGIKIQVSSFSFLITQHFDKILLSSFFGLAFTGYYEAATKIIYAVRDIPLFLMSVLTPFISRKMSTNDTASITGLYQKTTAQLAILSIFLMQILILNQRIILSFVLKGEPNDFTLLVFRLLTITGFWHVISGTSTYISRGMGKSGVEMKTNILTLVLNVGFSLLFMRLFSSDGVVYGTAVAMTLPPFISYYLTNNLLSLPTPRFLAEQFLPPVAISAVPFTASILFQPVITRFFHPVAAAVIVSVVFAGSTHLAYTLVHNKTYTMLLGLLPWPRRSNHA